MSVSVTVRARWHRVKEREGSAPCLIYNNQKEKSRLSALSDRKREGMDRFMAVVGCGGWGKNLIRNFSALGVLGAICDLESERLARLSQSCPDARATTSLDNILGDERIKGVAIATPASAHYGLTRRALESGKDVFVEKPLAMNVRDCGKLIAIASGGRRILMVDHVLRYHPAVRKLAGLINSGELGQIRYIYSNRLNIGRLRREENILWSFAPHDISVILSLVGHSPVEVTAFGEAYLQMDVYDTTVTNLVFSDKLKAHIFVSWLHPFKEQKLVVIGSRNMAVFDDLSEEKLFLYPHTIRWVGEVPLASKAARIAVPVGREEPLRNSCSHFIDCVRERRPPDTDGKEGMAVLEVLERAQQSLDGKTRGTNRAARARGEASKVRRERERWL